MLNLKVEETMSCEPIELL